MLDAMIIVLISMLIADVMSIFISAFNMIHISIKRGIKENGKEN